ncbi:hypothetical protein [Lacrimispora xylanisolvens]|uniref:hypothetical protein n=1 Tax=Lacrimispora xylanisolvens TaxID=384636 RepID=UPI002402A2A9
MKKNGVKMTASTAVVRIISYICVLFFSLMCLMPFLLMISASFSDEGIITREGFGLLPKGFSLAAYGWVFSISQSYSWFLWCHDYNDCFRNNLRSFPYRHDRICFAKTGFSLS